MSKSDAALLHLSYNSNVKKPSNSFQDAFPIRYLSYLPYDGSLIMIIALDQLVYYMFYLILHTFSNKCRSKMFAYPT